MKAAKLFSDTGTLRHKLRTINDLIDHITSREGEGANYNIFLGAGASVTSGIPPASALIERWALELYKNLAKKEANSLDDAINYFKSNHAEWYKSNNPYSSLFEKKCDLPSQRRRFIENLVDGKLPSIGYAYLINLVENGYFNAIFTTNFDDLINEAFYQFSNVRPIMCAHDSSVKGISITSARPKIIKLHGDYLFDDIKNTLRGTESLEKNTREKLIEFCKEFGLIVVGYSGSDRSVMDVLDVISKQDIYLNNGVYWCFRGDDEISPDLQNLLWRDKIYPVLIEGFDQLFSEIHFSTANRRLDIEASYDKSKIKATIKNILQDEFNLSKHKIIGDEIASIKNADNRREISNFLTNFSEEARKDSQISITDSRNLFAIENLISKNELDKAFDLAEQDYLDAENENVKPYYLQKIIDILEKKGEKTSILMWCDRLISCDTNNIRFQLQKSSFLSGERKIDYLKDILEKNPYSHEIINQYAASLDNFINTDPINVKYKFIDIISLLEKSLALEPSLSNIAWAEKYSTLISASDEIGSEIEEKIKNHLEYMENINPHHINTITLKSKYVARRKKFGEMKECLNNLKEIYEKSSKNKKISISLLMADIIENLPNAENNDGFRRISEEFFEKFLTEEHFQEEGVFYIYSAEYHLGLKHNLKKSEDFFKKAITTTKSYDFLNSIIDFLDCMKDEFISIVENVLEEHRYDFLEYRYHALRSKLSIRKADYENARRHLEKSFELGGSKDDFLSKMSYIYLLEENYKAVIKLFDENKDFSDRSEAEAFIINYYFAAKMLEKDTKKTKIQNLSAQSKSNDVKIAAFCILQHEQNAKNMIKDQIEKNFLNYFKFRSWPIIPNKWLDQIKSSLQIPEFNSEILH